ncbi:hypothetical protein ACIROS_09615 [Bacillus mobilis]
MEKERLEIQKVFKLLDYLLVFLLIITIVFRILMKYSTSSIVAVKNYGYSSELCFRSQLNKLYLELIICITIFVLWKGKVVNNAQPWTFGVQPAEFNKLSVIIVNLGGVTGIFPLTGTTLPFIRFNGSSLMAMGTLVNN